MIHLNPIPLHQEPAALYSFEDAVCIASDLASGEEDGWIYHALPWGGSDEPQGYVVEVCDDGGHLCGYWKDGEFAK